jgi:DNA replication and repair protein RecF
MNVVGLRVVGLRNLASGEIRLAPGTTVLWGPNGSGKTSVLEALCLGLAGRSCRTRTDREAIAFGQPLARVEVTLADAEDSWTFRCSLTRAGERRHRVNGSPVGPEQAARRPELAVFLPDRLALVKGSPATRRDHLDQLCAALWPARSEARRRYGRALAQRNALLARIRAGAAGAQTLAAWDGELARHGIELMAARAKAVEHVAAAFETAASELGLPGHPEVRYRPRSRAGSAEELARELEERRASDVRRGFTGHGPHLDELRIASGGRELRRYGSQGEQRVALLALLFAEREGLVRAGRTPPLMLLDDVMSELDPERRELLCARLEGDGGQAVITATEPARLPTAFPRHELRLRAGHAVAPVIEEARGEAPSLAA